MWLNQAMSGKEPSQTRFSASCHCQDLDKQKCWKEIQRSRPDLKLLITKIYSATFGSTLSPADATQPKATHVFPRSQMLRSCRDAQKFEPSNHVRFLNQSVQLIFHQSSPSCLPQTIIAISKIWDFSAISCKFIIHRHSNARTREN